MTIQQTPAPAARTLPTAAGVGPKRSLTPQHVMALRAIQDGAVVCHPAWSHHTPGWGWAEGGDVSLNLQVVLTDLQSLRLLAVDTGGRWHVDGDPAVLTEAGRIVLNRLGGAS